MLDRFKKGILENESKKALDLINQAGMVTETSFVLGTPEETKESIKQTLELAKEYSPDFAHFLLLAPWSYADMYDELEPYVETFDYSKYNLVEPIIKPVAMTRDELFQEVLNCYQGYYFSKMGEWAKLKDPFKKDYILRSMRVIMSNSFITQHIPKLGSMPKKLKKLLKSAN
jgi:anaerobic magnesium-protoporphyrin IX monomethyl ester cyclase